MRKPFLSVIIPAYNEADRLPMTLLDVDRYLSLQEFTSEIIVVDDGSTDNTKEIVRRFKSLIKNILILDNGTNKGRGEAIKKGMAAASGDWRLFMDADNSTSISELDKMIPYFKEGFEVLIGSRYLSASGISVHLPLVRRIAENFLEFLMKILFLVKKVRDVHCGFKCFSEQASKAIFPLSQISDWAFDCEILALAQKNHYSVKEVPVFWAHDLRSKMRLIDYWKVLCQTFKIRKRLWTTI